MAPVTIPQFLLPRGIPSTRAFQSLTRANVTHHRIRTTTRRCASDNSKPRVLEQPDKFRPPSHPARRVVQTRNGRVLGREPINYGPKLTEKEREEQKRKQYPNMFPPEGTVMHKFLTNRWIHIWIAMVGSFLGLCCGEGSIFMLMLIGCDCLERTYNFGHVYLHYQL